MTPIDQALATMRADMQHTENRHAFYRLFLSSVFFVPTFDESTGDVARGDGDEKMLPLIMEADGNQYMMIFDSEERVMEWGEDGVHCIALPGYVLVSMATEGLHLAMNVGTEHSKQFVPDEIAWLKSVVRESQAAAEQESQQQQ